MVTTRCIEFIHIYGDGRVSPCAGNEKVFGNLLEEPLKIIKQRILNYYPNLHPLKFDGFCPYREKINELTELEKYQCLASIPGSILELRSGYLPQ